MGFYDLIYPLPDPPPPPDDSGKGPWALGSLKSGWTALFMVKNNQWVPADEGEFRFLGVTINEPTK